TAAASEHSSTRFLHAFCGGTPMNPQQFLTTVEEAATVRRVFGEPIHADGVTVIPAATVRGGGGAGSRGVDGGGGGFGLTARPAGVFTIRNGSVRWRPALD